MLKIDRSAVDKAIEDLEMFTDTQAVLDNYETEKEVLVKRGDDLSKRIAELQEEHTQLLLDRESSKDNTSDYIYLSKQLTATNEEVQTIVSLQEQLKDDFKALKQKYIPVIQSTYGKDLSAKNQFPVNETIDYVKYELLKAIADYSCEVRKQQQPLLPLIGEFLEDEELMSNNAGFRRLFYSDSIKLSYFEAGKSVIAKNHVLSSIDGNLHHEIQKPKVKDGE